MTIGEYLKKKLEEDFLGQIVADWSGKPFVVHTIEVRDGGVDPQWEISLKPAKGNDGYYISYIDSEAPKII